MALNNIGLWRRIHRTQWWCVLRRRMVVAHYSRMWLERLTNQSLNWQILQEITVPAKSLPSHLLIRATVTDWFLYDLRAIMYILWPSSLRIGQERGISPSHLEIWTLAIPETHTHTGKESPKFSVSRRIIAALIGIISSNFRLDL